MIQGRKKRKRTLIVANILCQQPNKTGKKTSKKKEKHNTFPRRNNYIFFLSAWIIYKHALGVKTTNAKHRKIKSEKFIIGYTDTFCITCGCLLEYDLIVKH